MRSRTVQNSAVYPGRLQQQQQQLMDPIYKKAQRQLRNSPRPAAICLCSRPQYLYVDKAQCKDLTPEARKAMNIPEGRTIEDLQKELQAQAQGQQQ
ncbi:MAG: hypothetical protein ACLVGR_01585 [Anaerovoracaceae bacterium]